MIKFVTGDFFDYEADIRVNTVNCVGIMGAGVALIFKNKYPKMYDEYVKACENGYVRPGLPHVWEDNNFFGSGTIVINFPTKDHWKNPSEYEYVESGLVWLRTFLKERGNVKVTLPALGCGHGGLDWIKVRNLIEKYLDGIEATILAFEPHSSVNSEITNDLQNDLHREGVVRILPNDRKYPRKLAGRSAFNFYIKGDMNVFEKRTISIVVDSKASERELNAAIDCIDVLKKSFTFLFGYSNSAEITLVREALQRNAKVALVLPYGILELKIRKDLKPLWDENLITIVSLSNPKSSWSVGESINSLKFRLRVADAILIANHDWQSLEKYERELKSGNNLFFINYWDSKIDFYQKINAKQIGRSKETHLPNLQPILESQ